MAIFVPLTRIGLQWLRTPEELIDGAVSYLFIMLLGMGAQIFYLMISSVIRALGDSKTPLYFLIFSCFMNVVLDLVFIKVFHKGTGGVAVATVMTQLLAGILCLLYVRRKFPILRMKKEDWKMTRQFAWQHIRIGFPMAFQYSLAAIGCIVVQFMVNDFGKDYVSAYAIGGRVSQIATQPMFSIGIAVATYVAQNYGAMKFKRIVQGVNR